MPIEINTKHARGICSSSSIYGVRFVPLCIALFLTAACSTPQANFTRLAAAAGVTATLINGAGFTHIVYRRPVEGHSNANDIVLVFIEGDSAWVNDRPMYVHDAAAHTSGLVYTKRPVSDPTPRNPLAFHLMLRTAQPAWYITRPCYNGLHDSACNERVWADARYSEAVVESMATAIKKYATVQGERHLILVGYSGGGALAVLLAARLSEVIGVISVAANLDTQAWTETRHFEPLTASLNPAVDIASLAIPHAALVGDQDSQVPFSTVARFLAAQPQTVVTHYPNYDHTCCWENNWPKLLDAALAKLSMANVQR